MTSGLRLGNLKNRPGLRLFLRSAKIGAMKLFLLRHAEAEGLGAPGCARDSERPLTPDGEKTMKRVAKGMQQLELAFDLILTSPYLRARQTAEIAAAVLQARNKIKLSDCLAGAGDPADLISELSQHYRSLDDILVVGHEPYLSRLISKLTTGGTDLSLYLKKAGLAKITIEWLQNSRCATLNWLLTPHQLELLARGRRGTS
jgi:phosphohistidine phosphatase